MGHEDVGLVCWSPAQGRPEQRQQQGCQLEEQEEEQGFQAPANRSCRPSSVEAALSEG